MGAMVFSLQRLCRAADAEEQKTALFKNSTVTPLLRCTSASDERASEQRSAGFLLPVTKEELFESLCMNLLSSLSFPQVGTSLCAFFDTARRESKQTKGHPPTQIGAGTGRGEQQLRYFSKCWAQAAARRSNDRNLLAVPEAGVDGAWLRVSRVDPRDPDLPAQHKRRAGWA